MEPEVALLTACIGFLAAVISLLVKLPEIAALLQKSALFLGRFFKKIQIVPVGTIFSITRWFLKKLRMLRATFGFLRKKLHLLINTSKKTVIVTSHNGCSAKKSLVRLFQYVIAPWKLRGIHRDKGIDRIATSIIAKVPIIIFGNQSDSQSSHSEHDLTDFL